MNSWSLIAHKRQSFVTLVTFKTAIENEQHSRETMLYSDCFSCIVTNRDSLALQTVKQYYVK